MGAHLAMTEGVIVPTATRGALSSGAKRVSLLQRCGIVSISILALHISTLAGGVSRPAN